MYFETECGTYRTHAGLIMACAQMAGHGVFPVPKPVVKRSEAWLSSFPDRNDVGDGEHKGYDHWDSGADDVYPRSVMR